MRKHKPTEKQQRGAATLAVSLVILFLITLATLNSNKGAVLEQRISANHFHQARAFEAAQGGLNFAVSWLSAGTNTSSTSWTAAADSMNAAWTTNAGNPPYDQRNTASISAMTIGGHTVNVTLWRNSTSPTLIEVLSTASGEAQASVRQVVKVLGVSLKVPSVAPLTVNGCISGVTGNPDIIGASLAGHSIVTSAHASCIDSGHLNYTGTVQTNAFTGSAWDHTFDMSKAEMQLLASTQPGGPTGGPIYYYNDATVGSYSPSNLGSPTSPVLIIFDLVTTAECPKINGGRTIYGIVYCGRGYDLQGWGGTDIYGGLIIDTDLTKYTANANLRFHSLGSLASSYSSIAESARVAGTWRDF